MRTKFTLLATALLLYVGLQAQTQIPNGGFETWNDSVPSYPLGWDSYDHMLQTAFHSPTSSLKMTIKDTASANVHAGSASARLQTVSFPGFGALTGGLSLGSLGFDGQKPIYHAVPFTDKPVTFNGALKYEPAGADTGTAKVFLTKWDATGDSEIIVGKCLHLISGSTATFATFSDSILYLSSATPDSLQVRFTSSLHADSTNVGTFLWVDDLSFTYATTGLVHFSTDDAVKVFPNPASSALNISVDDYMVGDRLLVYDISGKLVNSVVIKNATSVIDLSGYANGTYLFRLNDKNDKMVYQNKFVVTK